MLLLDTSKLAFLGLDAAFKIDGLLLAICELPSKNPA